MKEPKIERLTWPEILSGAIVGIMRHIENLKKGKGSVYGECPENDWQRYIEGALAEMFFSKKTGRYWHKGRPGDCDVMDDQIRATEDHANSLILHKEDRDDQKYYLITGINGSYCLRGWLYGRDGKQEKYWRDPTKKGRPAYFVPQSALRPMEEDHG